MKNSQKILQKLGDCYHPSGCNPSKYPHYGWKLDCIASLVFRVMLSKRGLNILNASNPISSYDIWKNTFISRLNLSSEPTDTKIFMLHVLRIGKWAWMSHKIFFIPRSTDVTLNSTFRPIPCGECVTTKDNAWVRLILTASSPGATCHVKVTGSLRGRGCVPKNIDHNT